MRSLRDLGYDFAQAVADVVDNSIEAKAATVAIDIEFDGDDSWVRVADNGAGMRPDVLREALRYGTEREYRVDDLGKFGLGLKTASMSQCRRMSVATRSNHARADIAAYSWDLAHIERTNRWEILPLSADSKRHIMLGPLKETTGTVVLWERLDRILGYKQPYGEAARKRVLQMCREVEIHLGMVFHRFLLGEVRGRRLKVLLNGNEIKAWDPFCRHEPKTKVLPSKRIRLEHDGVAGDILVEPFVLPHQDDFTSPDAFRLAAGPASWNQQQGLYIYRAGRMIQSGGWSGLRAPDEHTKLARLSISFPPKLDDVFQVNVAKMRVQLPAQVREALHDVIGPVVKLAREIYDRKSKRNVASTSVEGKAPANSSADGTRHGKNAALGLLTFDEWARRVRNAATEREIRLLDTILERVRKANAHK